jgi:hypothetical protein
MHRGARVNLSQYSLPCMSLTPVPLGGRGAGLLVALILLIPLPPARGALLLVLLLQRLPFLRATTPSVLPLPSSRGRAARAPLPARGRRLPLRLLRLAPRPHPLGLGEVQPLCGRGAPAPGGALVAIEFAGHEAIWDEARGRDLLAAAVYWTYN